MTFPVKGLRIEEAPECGVRTEAMIANARVCRVTETAPWVLLGASHIELLAYFDADGASNDPHEAINLWIDATHRTGHGSHNFDNYRPRLLLAHSASLAIRNTRSEDRPRFVTESQFCCDNCRSIDARRL
jgi:hypothetical protein